MTWGSENSNDTRTTNQRQKTALHQTVSSIGTAKRVDKPQTEEPPSRAGEKGPEFFLKHCPAPSCQGPILTQRLGQTSKNVIRVANGWRHPESKAVKQTPTTRSQC